MYLATSLVVSPMEVLKFQVETEECRSLETNFALPWFPQQKQTKVDEMSQQQHELLSKSAQKLDCTTNAAKLASLYIYIEKMSFSSSTMLLCYNYYNYFMANSWVKSCVQNVGSISIGVVYFV